MRTLDAREARYWAEPLVAPALECVVVTAMSASVKNAIDRGSSRGAPRVYREGKILADPEGFVGLVIVPTIRVDDDEVDSLTNIARPTMFYLDLCHLYLLSVYPISPPGTVTALILFDVVVWIAVNVP